MNKLLYVFFSFIFFSFSVFATEFKESQIKSFFDEYVSAANSYSPNYFDYYIDNPKIIRVVEGEDGRQTSVQIPFDKYKSETKKSLKLAKLRKYRNLYSNIRIFKQGKDYKVVAMRMPTTSDYKLPSYFIIGEDSKGELKIKEESMNTRVQRFLNDA